MARPTDKGLISKSKLIAIGNSIRSLIGSATQYTPDGMAETINAIPKRTEADVNVTSSGTVTVAKGYYASQVEVTVPGLDPTQWDTWVINEDLSNMYFQGEYDRFYTCPIILFDGRVASDLNPYSYDNGSTTVQTLGFYLDRTTHIEVYSGEDSPGTWTDQRYRTIKVPAFIKTYPKGSEYTGGGYGSLYAFLQEYATLST